MSKTANVMLKDSPAEPLLPQKLFTEPDLVSLAAQYIFFLQLILNLISLIFSNLSYRIV